MQNVYRKLGGLFVLAVLFSAGQVVAEEYMGADAVKALVVGNTISATHLKKGFDFKVYFDADGETAHRQQDGSTTITTYKFDGDKLCIHWKGSDRCANILDNGDSTYTRVLDDGKRVVKWTKITKGKDL